MPIGVYKRTPEMLAAIEAGRAVASPRRPPKCGIRDTETGEVMSTVRQVRAYWQKKHGINEDSSHARKIRNQLKKNLANGDGEQNSAHHA